jgi:hypothetical protein
MVGLPVTSGTHMCLRDILIYQPDFAHENPVTTLPWLEPPFANPSALNVLDTPRDQRTPGEVAGHLNIRFRPAPLADNKSKEMRWVATYLNSELNEETTPKDSYWEVCASLFVAVDILTYHDGIRNSGFEGHTSATSRRLLVLIA